MKNPNCRNSSNLAASKANYEKSKRDLLLSLQQVKSAWLGSVAGNLSLESLYRCKRSAWPLISKHIQAALNFLIKKLLIRENFPSPNVNVKYVKLSRGNQQSGAKKYSQFLNLQENSFIKQNHMFNVNISPHDVT